MTESYLQLSLSSARKLGANKLSVRLPSAHTQAWGPSPGRSPLTPARCRAPWKSPGKVSEWTLGWNRTEQQCASQPPISTASRSLEDTVLMVVTLTLSKLLFCSSEDKTLVLPWCGCPQSLPGAERDQGSVTVRCPLFLVCFSSPGACVVLLAQGVCFM